MRNEKRKILFCMMIIFRFSFLTFPLFAEHEFSLRLAPAVEVPLNIPEFKTGFGADASLDWAFWQFAKKFNLGVSAGGSFSSLPFETGDPLVLTSGIFGPFIRYRPFDRWAFRAGLNAGFYHYSRKEMNENDFLFGGSLGAEFFLTPYLSLYADTKFIHRVFTTEPLQTFVASIGIRLNISEIMGSLSRIHMEKTQQYNVFPVSWAWYEHNPLAAVTVTNDEPNAITDVQLSFYMDSFMSQPWVFSVVPRLEPGESVEVPITSLFNEAMMNLNETVNANGLLQVQYRSLGSRKNNNFDIQMPIFRRNMLSWDDDRRAAAFVSPYDFSAQAFARYIASAINNEQLASNRLQRIPLNVIYAAALFEGLRLYGISYIVDPASSYVVLSEDASALDSLNYPYETLKYRGGDCDDLSILFCSLLETLGVETAFVTVPGHIFVAFTVGDDNWQARNSDIITIDGKRWLPVEVTIPGEGFARAWNVGARQIKISNEKLEMRNGQEAESNLQGAVLYPIREAWRVYPSVTVPVLGDNLQDLPDLNTVIEAISRELAGRR